MQLMYLNQQSLHLFLLFHVDLVFPREILPFLLLVELKQQLELLLEEVFLFLFVSFLSQLLFLFSFSLFLLLLSLFTQSNQFKIYFFSLLVSILIVLSIPLLIVVSLLHSISHLIPISITSSCLPSILFISSCNCSYFLFSSSFYLHWIQLYSSYSLVFVFYHNEYKQMLLDSILTLLYKNIDLIFLSFVPRLFLHNNVYIYHLYILQVVSSVIQINQYINEALNYYSKYSF